MKATVLGGGKKVPAIDRPGSMANTLRQTMQDLAKDDAQRIREVESITGQKVRAPRKASAGEGATVRASGRRSVSGTLGDNLKKLAQSDARMMRGIGEIVRDATPKVSGRKGGKSIGGGKKALPPASSKPPAPKPPSRAKGSRARLPGMSGVVAKPKGLKPGALAERRAAKTQKPINTSPTRKPRKSKYQVQIVDQANRILDRLKLRMVTNAKRFNRYNLEDRIAKVNKIAKTAIPGYRHNPMRKNSIAKSAYQERNRRYGKAATAARNIARGSEFFRYGRYID
jgi:hypothetical protein